MDVSPKAREAAEAEVQEWLRSTFPKAIFPDKQGEACQRAIDFAQAENVAEIARLAAPEPEPSAEVVIGEHVNPMSNTVRLQQNEIVALRAEVERLMSEVKAAFREGWENGEHRGGPECAWRHSAAKRQLEDRK